MEGKWSVEVKYGDPDDAGREFEISALLVDRGAHEGLRAWVDAVKETGMFPPVRLPKFTRVRSHALRMVIRSLS